MSVGLQRPASESILPDEQIRAFIVFSGEMDRLVEAITVMRRLWPSNTCIDFDGKYFKMKRVYLYTKPKTEPKIYFSGVGPKSAYYAGKHGGHQITLTSHNPFERCRDVIFPSFE